MSFCCSQCSFTAQFESALMMHHQLHHEGPGLEDTLQESARRCVVKATTLPRASSFEPSTSSKDSKGYKLGGRSSATRLFDKLKAKICRSRQALFVHPEECSTSYDLKNGITVPSECTSKAFKYKSESAMKCPRISEMRESFGCHLCPFVADRITVLDRHLLNDHQIGLDNLLKLVMAKTKDGLEDKLKTKSQHYYTPTEDSEFLVETVNPTVKFLKHSSTNTDSTISGEDLDFFRKMQDVIKVEKNDKKELFDKMRVLNEYMIKFADSTNVLKKFKDHKARDYRSNVEEPHFDLGLGDQDTPRDWGRAVSENLERRNQDRPKYKTDDVYF